MKENDRAKQQAKQGKAFTTFLLLHGNGGNEQDLIPLAYELDKRAAILSPRGKVLEKSQGLSFIVYSLSFQLTAFFLVASRIDDMNEKKMITPAKGEPAASKRVL